MKKVFIAVTAYDSKVDTDCAMSIVNNMETLRRNGHDFHLHFETGCCYIALARSKCVAKFLESDATDLVFVDSDLAFDHDAIAKLIAHDRDVVCGAYPFKGNELGFPIRVITNGDGTPVVDKYTGLIEIEGGPTGLFRIQRSVLEKMCVEECKSTAVTDNGNPVYMLFDTGMLREKGVWWGEDYLFCLRWKDMGGRIWCEPSINFEHIGRHAYKGNYHQYLQAQVKPEQVGK